MSQLGLDGLRAERDAMLDVLRGLDDHEWNAPSAEAGSSVRDVVAHVASTHRGVIDREHLPGNGDPVKVRRSWSITDLVDEFATYTAKTTEVFGSMQGSDKRIPMAQFGMHPVSALPDLYLFDMYGHLRADVLRPYGPVDREEPPRDEQRVRPTVEWMLGAWPHMCPPADGAIELVLDGAGGGTWTVGGNGTALRATVHSAAHDFVLWGTARQPYSGYVQIDGETAYAHEVLARVKII